eukprot:TRINITY_DN1065_c0_g1_i2.p1 TRINITY_DN1065_c0_g1~~TRINITY_DN1065_c0_g1_i2.p1  ORF type:complete len:115 (+),score=20.53 TRINITY_DN1065_c0_g1_i2:135-479(+)
MAKSLRSKKKKRLRTLRREIVKPFYEIKETAKLAAQEAALAAPKVPVRTHNTTTTTITTSTSMDVEMAEGGTTYSGNSESFLKPVGGIGKSSKKKSKLKRGKHRGRGKVRRKNI